ncbi:MAG: hypothetical protein GKR90_10960 [Pseudomonadales bacterium]|nr:hypothetical protein [Pseudomonadales bacterium]
MIRFAVFLVFFAILNPVFANDSASLTALPAWAAVDKGDFQYSEPDEYPIVALNLDRIERQVGMSATERCGSPLAAAPLDLGNAESFMGKMLGKAANAAIGKLVGGLLGGGGGSSSKKKPKLDKDPIKKKFKTKVEHPGGDARIRIGGQSFDDGLLLSARVEKAAGKGTFHTMFLEQPDCTRYWPERYQQYGLWGSWSLNVSVTKTTSTYRDGQLVNRTSDHSSWSKSGNFDFNRGFSLWDQLPGEAVKMVLDADQAYLTQLRREIDLPAWQQLGHAKPTDGVRSAGGMFRLDPSVISEHTLAVVHITHVDKGRYKTVGFPLRFVPEEDGRFSFEYVN